MYHFKTYSSVWGSKYDLLQQVLNWKNSILQLTNQSIPDTSQRERNWDINSEVKKLLPVFSPPCKNLCCRTLLLKWRAYVDSCVIQLSYLFVMRIFLFYVVFMKNEWDAMAIRKNKCKQGILILVRRITNKEMGDWNPIAICLFVFKRLT